MCASYFFWIALSDVGIYWNPAGRPFSSSQGSSLCMYRHGYAACFKGCKYWFAMQGVLANENWTLILVCGFVRKDKFFQHSIVGSFSVRSHMLKETFNKSYNSVCISNKNVLKSKKLGNAGIWYAPFKFPWRIKIVCVASFEETGFKYALHFDDPV